MNRTTTRLALGAPAAVAVLGLMGLVSLLAGCNSDGGSTAVLPTASGTLNASQLPTEYTHSATPSATYTSPKPTYPTYPAQTGSLKANPSGNAVCFSQGIIYGIADASGAVHSFVILPATGGPQVKALGSAAATATAVKALHYAVPRLQAAITSAAGCTTTAGLVAQAKKTVTALEGAAKSLTAGTATAAELTTMERSVNTLLGEGTKIGLRIADRNPDVALINRQASA